MFTEDTEDLISYEILSDKKVRVYEVPDGDNNSVTVEMRPVTASDTAILEDIQKDPSISTYRLLAHIITKWGERNSITSLELAEPQRWEAVLLLDQCATKFCIKRYKFIPKSKGFSNSGLHTK